MTADPSLYAVQAVLILDSEGRRLLAKYYEPPYDADQFKDLKTLAEQKTFEKGLHDKTYKQAADVIIYESKVVVYKQYADISIFIVGDLDENEAMLYQAVVGLYEAIGILLKRAVDKRTLLENYDLIALAVDETVDSGIILEVDPLIICTRVSKAPAAEPSINNIEFNEQGLSTFMQFARNKLSEKIKENFNNF